MAAQWREMRNSSREVKGSISETPFRGFSMEQAGSLSCSQEPATGAYTESGDDSSYPHLISLRSIL
jgi:hypothetical protein